MAYNSTRNYAQEINDLIAAGGDPAEVNRLLNERLEKQQSMDTGYSTYDDVYKNAMDYLSKSGYTPQASANVNYAEIANQILTGQGEADMTDRSWADLGTVLDARDKKLGTGNYDKWVDSTIGGGEDAMKYNGEGSLYQYLQDYATYSQQQNDAYRLAAEALKAQYGNDGKVYGMLYTGSSGLTDALKGITSGTTDGGTASGGGVTVGGVGGGMQYIGRPQGLGYDSEDWERKQNRENAQNLVGETNAVTKAPVQGEENSYSKANTNKAFEAAIQALVEAEDYAGAQALKDAWGQYEETGAVEILMSALGNQNGGQQIVGGGTTTTTGTTTGGTSRDLSTGFVAEDTLIPGATVQKTQAQNGGLTDEQVAAILAQMGYTNTPVFSFAGTEFDKSTLGSKTGDTAVQQAAQILGGGQANKGQSVTDKPVLAKKPAQDTTMYYADTTAEPYEVTAQRKDAAYRQAYSQAAASGDASAMNAVMAEWNAWKQSMRRQLTEAQVAALGW